MQLVSREVVHALHRWRSALSAYEAKPYDTPAIVEMVLATKTLAEAHDAMVVIVERLDIERWASDGGKGSL